MTTKEQQLLAHMADIVAAYLETNTIDAQQLPALIGRVHASLAGLGAAEEAPREPAVSPGKSVKPDHIICLEDGKRFKSLKRHLRSAHGLSADEYRSKWNLPRTYPMVAPNYAAERSELAKSTGLGRQRAARTGRKAKRA